MIYCQCKEINAKIKLYSKAAGQHIFKACMYGDVHVILKQSNFTMSSLGWNAFERINFEEDAEFGVEIYRLPLRIHAQMHLKPL